MNYLKMKQASCFAIENFELKISSILVALFTVGLFFILAPSAHAATVTWDGGAGTLEWNTANNWSNNAVPTSEDDVTIDNAAVTATTTAINFSTLTIGNGTNTSSLTLTANIGTGGSITINNAGTLTQNQKVQQTISGTLTINSGGNLTHTANTTANTYNVNFSAANITLNGTGTINTDNRGYTGQSGNSGIGNGPGGGGTNSTCCGGSAGGGGGHGGLGGGGSALSGASYDSTTNPTDLGSGGGNNTGGSGGGAIILTVSGTLTVNGTISANGQTPSTGIGGGGGGTVNITTGTITGSGTIRANGGNGRTCCGIAGGGGGGRIAIVYTTDTTALTTLSAYGGTGSTSFEINLGYGGPGTIYQATQAGTNRILTIDNNSNNSANQGAELTDYSIPLDSIVLKNRGNLHIKSGSTMTVTATLINNGVGNSNGILSNDGTLTFPSSYTLDGYTLWANASGTISGLTVLTIGSTGTLSHGYNTTTKEKYINLSLTTLTINASGTITANGLGYTSGPGDGQSNGVSAGGSGGGGGGHGGVGGFGTPLATGTAFGGNTYDSVTNPTDLGSTGGGNVPGAVGGGVIILSVSGTLTNNGTISANGNNAVTGITGGAGGSVNITVGTLAGTGSITVNGGNGRTCCATVGGGGGGRIAIKYNTDSSSFSALTAYGGSGSTNAAGGAGTIYKATQAGANRTLIIDNNSQSSGSSGAELDDYTIVLDSIILRNGGILHIKQGLTMTVTANLINSGSGSNAGILSNDGTLILPSTYTLDNYTLWAHSGGTISGVTTLTVGSTGIISHASNTTTKTNFINLSLANLTINSGGSINVNSKGYSGGNGSGTVCASSATGSGGGHGGQGGTGSNCSTIAPTYDSATNPTDLGSGGSGSSGASGGGVVILTISGTLTNNGSITANGGAGGTNQAGGAGGTVNITAGTLAGTGTITANGGNGYSNSGGGGGGRISIIYTNDTSTFATLSAYGGTGQTTGTALTVSVNNGYGGAGTIYKATQGGASRTLIVDNNSADSGNQAAELDDYTIGLDSIQLQNLGNLHIKSGSSMAISANEINNGVGNSTGILSNDGTLTLPSSYTLDGYTLWANASGTISGLTVLTIGSTGTLSHGYNYSAAKTNYLNLSLTTLTVNSGGAINVNGKGYASGFGVGLGCSVRGGGSYGGMGGAGTSCATTASPANGSLTNPIDLGSSGRGGGAGGGLILLSVSGTLTLNGSMTATGTSGNTSSNTGAGSGGAVNITTGTLTGSGSISSIGGNGNAGGGGGGGRIALTITTNSYTGTATATGGTSSSGGAGATGTVYWGTPTLTNVTTTATTPNTNSITGVKTIAFWVKPTATTTNFLKLATGVEVGVSSGTLTTSGITSPTTYINGAAGGTVTANSWNHVVVTTASGITADSVTIGQNSGGYLSGQLDDVRVYTSEYSSGQVSSLYTQQNSIDANISTTASAEEYAPTRPVSYWKLDDGRGTTANDSTTTSNHGTLGGSTLPTWQGESQCIAGKCLYFDGSSSKVTMANSSNGIQSVSFWVKPKTTTQGLIQIGSGYSVSVSSGAVSTAGFVNPNIYVNGRLSGGNDNDGVSNAVVTANTWNHIVVTTSTSFTANSIILGQASAVVLNGFLDEVKIYDFALTAAQTRAAFVARGATMGPSAVLGDNNEAIKQLSNGLLSYWKFDESSGNASDSSGNSLTLTNNNSTSYTGGKFGNGPTFNGTTQYFNTATTITGVKTVSFWVKPAALTNNYINLTSSIRLTSNSSGVISATGFTSPSIYVNGTLNASLTVNTWNHVLVTTATAFNPNATEIGRANSAYLSSGSIIDEVRFYNRQFTPVEINSLYNFTSGPVAYYNFEEGTTGTTYDKSGNGNNGTDTGTSVVNGKYGKARSFNGSSDYVTISNNTSLNPSDFTFSAWIKTSQTSSGRIITKEADSNGNQRYSLNVNTGTANKAEVRFDPSDGTSAVTAVSTTSVNNNTWYYVTGVFDDTANTLLIYVNGVLETTTSTTKSPATSSNVVEIGRFDSQFGQYFNGSIDDVRIYNYAQTQKQIVSDMNAGHPGVGSPIASAVGHWKFDEGVDNRCSGGTNDACNSGNGGSALDGAISGMASPATSTSGWTQSGKVGRGLVFDGTNDFVNIGNPTGVQLTGSFTTSAWINLTTNDTAHRILAKAASGAATDIGYMFYTSSTGKLVLLVSSDGTTQALRTSSTTLSTGTWYFVTGVYNASSQTITLYINGAPDSGTLSGTVPSSIFNSTSNLYIGATTGPGAPMSGTMDEVKIYNYALTADEVKVDMNAGKSQVLGASGTNSSSSSYSSSQEYCIPGDSTSCAAPVGRWDFEENTGVTAYDKSGNANNGTLTSGPTWANGKVGRGLSFDGSDDYVSTSKNFTETNIALSAWIKISSTPDANKDIISNFNSGGTSSTYTLRLNSSGRASFQVQLNGANQTAADTSSLATNSWHHVVGTYDGSSIRLYVNGKLITTTSASGTLGTGGTVSIGRAGDFSGEYFSGQIDQVRVYNYARTAAQVAWDYNRGAPIGHWKMDECQGTTIYDKSGNANNGTLTIGASGTQTSAGTCQGSANTAWKDGVNGKINYSLDFDGTDDYVDIAHNSIFNITGDITLSAFVKPRGTAGAILVKQSNSTNLWDYAMYLYQSKLYFYASGLSPNVITSTNNISTDIWSHVVVTRNGSTLNMYINGVLDKSTTMTGSFGANSYSLYMGNDQRDAAVKLNGQLDDVRVYNYALTATQVKDVFNGGAVNFKPLTGSP